ncbi:MAG: hypothetical protein ACPL7K_07135, partial [Armatimonadota bacterium]
LRDNVVTCATADWFYVEDPQRVSGIRVQKTSHGLTVGTKPVVVGTIQTDSSGERYVIASSVANEGSGTVGPLAMRCKSVGGGDWRYDPATGSGQRGVEDGVGLTNIGLLVTTFGRVLQIDPSNPAEWFVIDDGSGANLKCIVPPDVAINRSWQYVRVTGISACEKVGGEIYPVLRIRQQTDVTAVL